MTKAFSLLELMIVILIISIISIFAIPKLNFIFENSNLVKLKSEYALIQNGISNIKQKRVLLNQNDEVDSLDDSNTLKKNERLFSKVIDFDIISTDNKENFVGKWLKLSQVKYQYFLSSNEKIIFILEDSFFKCKSPVKVCKELQ